MDPFEKEACKILKKDGVGDDNEEEDHTVTNGDGLRMYEKLALMKRRKNGDRDMNDGGYLMTTNE